MKRQGTLREYLNAQIKQVFKYKSYLARFHGKDPLLIYSMNQIFFMWTKKYADKFRKSYIRKYGNYYK